MYRKAKPECRRGQHLPVLGPLIVVLVPQSSFHTHRKREIVNIGEVDQNREYMEWVLKKPNREDKNNWVEKKIIDVVSQCYLEKGKETVMVLNIVGCI